MKRVPEVVFTMQLKAPNKAHVRVEILEINNKRALILQLFVMHKRTSS